MVFQRRGSKNLPLSRKPNISPWEYFRWRLQTLLHQRVTGNVLFLNSIPESALGLLMLKMRATGTLYIVMGLVKGMVKWAL
jgi:hypothetical protein